MNPSTPPRGGNSPGRSPNDRINGSALCPQDSIANSNTSQGNQKDFFVDPEHITSGPSTDNPTETHEERATKDAHDTEDNNDRRIFNYAMRDFRLGGASQRNTAVLMLSWAKELDDLNTEDEVNKLEEVFTNLLRYKVIKRQISGEKPPAIQLSKYLADFVFTYDSPSTLLIVYYAGHGIPKVPGGLHFAGNRQPDKKLSNQTAAAWHDAEHIIRDAEADALLIFDCCYAGNLTLRNVRASRPSRSFEYIAACGVTGETNFPGPQSFTSALIWALSDLVKTRKRFTTLELQNKIMIEAEFFPRKQSVLVMERDDSCDQRLVLAPLPLPANGESASFTHTIDELPQHHFDLRFWYQSRPDGVEIDNVANRLKRLIKAQNIDARCISWLGRNTHPTDIHLDSDTDLYGFDSTQSMSSDYQTGTDASMDEEYTSVNGSVATGTHMIHFEGTGRIVWRVFRDLGPTMLPVATLFSLGLWAWHRFRFPSFPFKIR